MGDASGRQLEDCAEVKREAGAARMITAARVDEHDVRSSRQGPDGGLEQPAVA